MLAISAVALLLTAVWYGTRVDSLTITNVEVTGGETIDHKAVRRLIETELEGEYAGFIPRRFAWFYPHDDIKNAVAQVKRIDSIEVARVDGRTVQVTFDEFLPYALWCASVTENTCVFLDETGYAYAQAPDLNGGSFLRYVHLSDEPTVGQNVVATEDFALLTQLTELLAQAGWIVSHVEIDSVRDAFLHIVGGGEFKVTLTQPPSETVENLMVVLTSPDFEDIQPGTFQYIDLRFGNKVFVNEEPDSAVEEGVETETATSSEAAIQE